MKRTLATLLACFALMTATAGSAHAACGDEGEKACPIFKGKACKGQRINVKGRCESCGGEGQRACPITVKLQGCDGKQIEVEGRCQPCGGGGQRACPITVQKKGCDGRQVEVQGRCEPCGGTSQRACPVTVQVKGCNGKQIEVQGRCEPCGATGQRACPVTVQLKGCDGRQIEVKGRCQPCGKLNQRACPVTVAMPSCESRELTESGGRCTLSAEHVADPITILNKTDAPLFYTVHFSDIERKVDYGGPFNVLKEGKVGAGGNVEVTLAGNTCLPAGVKRDNLGVAFNATRSDSCRGQTFGIIFWKSEKAFRDRVRDAAGADALRAVFGKAASKIVGGGAGLALGQIATGYFNWVINEMYGVQDGQIPYAWALTSIVPSVPQEGLWVAYWGERRPVETGLYKDEPPDLSGLTSPCSRPAPAKFSLVVKGQQTQGVWACGVTPSPG